MSGSYAVEGILVVNLNAEKETRTDSFGIFRIAGKAGDTLIVTDPGIIPLRIVVDARFSGSVPIVNVEMNEVYQLEEVVLEKTSGLTSEALGLVPEGQKRYTSQERKLYTAGDFKMIHLLGLLGGSFPLDPVLNALNGRTKMLKKSIEVEKNEAALEVLSGMFTNDEIEKDYSIPADYVQGFLYYCVEDAGFGAAVKAKNITLARFLMSGLAINYITLLNEDQDQDEK